MPGSIGDDRVQCCVIGCRRTTKAGQGYDEWICAKHWPTVPKALRARYARAKRLRRRRASKSMDRVVWQIWGRCKDAAFSEATGLGNAGL